MNRPDSVRCGCGAITLMLIAVGGASTCRAGATPTAGPAGKEAASPTAPAWPALKWQKGTASPFARVESPTALIDGKLYLFGGFTEELDASNHLDVYDPANDSWTRKKEMPLRVTHLNPAIDGNTVWLVGGFKGKHPGPATDEVWHYDIASDAWTLGPPLPEARAGGGLVIIDHTLHYFGGFKDRNAVSGSHWSLSLEGGKTWEPEPDLPEPRGHLAAAVLDGKIYALGGTNGHDITQVDLNFCDRFDPATKKWTSIAPLPDGRSHFEGSTIVERGRILIAGGRCNATNPSRNVVNDFLEYNPTSNSWSVVATMPEKIMAPSVEMVSGKIVVTGGGLNNPRPLTANTWSASIPDAK